MALENVKRCPAKLGKHTCDSAVFYDWGLVIMGGFSMRGPSGEALQRYEGAADPSNIKICARCTTPYVIENGELLDISEELGAEDVKAVLARGQTTGPHPKIKDP